jgi:putative ABC transport system ATP-binding protein
MTTLIKAENLSRHYGAPPGVMALKEANFTIEQGEFVAIMGPSGSGKSTLLSIMGALNSPSKGSYEVDGLDIYRLSSDQRADFRREYLGFVFQNFHLLPYLNLAENVMLPLTTKKLTRKEKKEMAYEALRRVGLDGLEERLPSLISGGEQERTAIARAIVNNPPVVLADEPTGNLDETTGLAVMGLLKSLSEDGTTVVMVTHNYDYATFAERIMRLKDGTLAISGD